MENKKKKRIVIALGGNALGNTLPEQMKAVKITAKAIVDLIQEGCEVIVAHGNGPQVGMINNAMAALSREDANQPNTPLSVCVAMSQAYIGYDLQNALREELYNRDIYDIPVATMITQVRVDADDPAFETPSKPIGHFMTEEQAKIAEEKYGYSTNVKISEIKHTKALVTWDSVLTRAAVEGYNVYLDGEKVNATPVKETRYELTGLKVGTKYNVAVTAVNEEGTESEITEEVEETFITMADMEKLNNTVEDAKKALEEKEKYTEESLKKLQEVYEQYQNVLNGENVTQEQVDEAKAAIEKAFKDLKVKETADDKKDDNKKDDNKKDDNKKDDNKKDDNKKPAAGGGSTGSGSTGGGSTGSGTTGSGSAGKGSNSITSPKTGDTMNVTAWALAFAASAAAAGTVVVKRKKED